MPEYLAPGVYVEETSFRAKTIEGVSTSTAAFVGPTRFGPTSGAPELVTSFAEFERIYAGLDQLEFTSGTKVHNFAAQAVRSFFEEGGRRLYVARVFKAKTGDDGIAETTITASTKTLTLKARYPGASGNVPVTFNFRLGPDILGTELVDPTKPTGATYPVLRGAANYDLVWVRDKGVDSPPVDPSSLPLTSPPSHGQLYWLERYFDGNRYTFRLHPWGAAATPVPLASLDSAAILSSPPAAGSGNYEVRILTVNVTVGRLGQFGQDLAFQNLTFHPDHPNSLAQVFAANPSSKATALYVPLVFATSLTNGAEIAYVLLSQNSLGGDTLLNTLNDPQVSDADRTFRVLLTGGNDGDRPGAAEYEGQDGSADGNATGLHALETIEDISIVAAPGSTYGYETTYKTDAMQIVRLLIGHAERMRYRIAVIDCGDGQLLSQVRAFRAQIDSSYAAFYYPWVRILDPVTRQEINLPPSGFVTGIYARNDVETGVHKAPANEVVRSAIGFEFTLNKAQQDVLNPEGINCFRFFEGRGYRLWGARTASSDPEWKYVNLRRYFAYLERSIDKGTQWVVFMNNAEGLWAKVQQTIVDFLYNEWKSERLMGTKPEEAYFVRCDRSTMTQNDLDNGRLIVLVGVSPIRPAEFVIFRIGQWTADAKQ
jgi:phage tail sheath protein FI